MNQKILGCFGSDNYSGVCNELMEALSEANQGMAFAYGGDPYTAKALQAFKKAFGDECEAFFAFNGTGANVASLSTMLNRCESIICAETSHIHTQETGAIYAYAGCKLITIPSEDGKITPTSIENAFHLESSLDRHASKPRVVTISQSTEWGTIYTLEEIAEISRLCKRLGLLLHVDGCRLANAAVSLYLPLKEFSHKCGIDVMTFGGTKNGMMFGEAVLFFRKDLAALFPYIQKQSLQLASKMRYISAQFIPYLEKGLWKRNAEHANKMAKLLAMGLEKIPGVTFTQKVETNQLFFTVPKHWVEKLSENFVFLVWDSKPILRFITSFNTKEDEIHAFISAVKQL